MLCHHCKVKLPKEYTIVFYRAYCDACYAAKPWRKMKLKEKLFKVYGAMSYSHPSEQDLDPSVVTKSDIAYIENKIDNASMRLEAISAKLDTGISLIKPREPEPKESENRRYYPVFAGDEDKFLWEIGRSSPVCLSLELAKAARDERGNAPVNIICLQLI